MKSASVCFCLLFVACAKSVHVYTPAPVQSVHPEFIFASFSMKALSETNREIRLLELKKISGVLKSAEPSFVGKNYLTIRQVAESNAMLTALIIEHPLTKSVEYVNDAGVIDWKEIELKEAEFFVRMPVHESATYLDVVETHNGMTTPRFRTTLPPH